LDAVVRNLGGSRGSLMHDRRRPRLVLYSELALYPIHWAAFQRLCAEYDVEGVAFSRLAADLPAVHQQLGWADETNGPIAVRTIPGGSSISRIRWLRRELRALQPDAIWLQQEPTDPLALELLAVLRSRREPQIVCAVCENLFAGTSLRVRLAGRLLWSRIDALAAVATRSLEGIQAIGMPSSIPSSVLVAGALPPPTHIAPATLPFAVGTSDFVVGFAGRITREKGWRDLAAAVATLPPSFKLLLAGSDNDPTVHETLAEPALRGRAAYVGLLDREALWRFYASLDCLVLPSLTTSTWTEQFGGVLADAMAVGIPILGSSSGAIPEVIGPAGLVFPEGDVPAIAESLQRLSADPSLRESLGRRGRERFEREFSIPAYAHKLANLLGLTSPAELRHDQSAGVAST
jgi:glycosyltransferase involved in cell wall biosynthesis